LFKKKTTNQQANKLQNNPTNSYKSSLLSKIKILHGRVNVILNSISVTSLFKHYFLLNVIIGYQLQAFKFKQDSLKKKKGKLDDFK